MVDKQEANEEKIVRNGEVKVNVTPDRLEVYLKVISAINGNDATYEDAIRELKKSNVVYGINEELLKEIFENKVFDQEILIANGLPPIDGVDGEIKYFFDTKREIKAKEDEKGNVDFKDLSLIQNIKKGEKLAEVMPPKPGVEGKTVTGNPIPPAEGKKRLLPQGKNTMPMPENPNILISVIDGHIIFKKDILVEVEPAYVVSANVDYSTGNIDYVGSILVKGDVKSGFDIKVGGDIDIWGVVEDAKIEAGGGVLLQKGIIGKGGGVVKAGGDVILKFIENQNIYSKGNVIVGEEILHSKVYADGKIIVKGKKGFIIGGEVVAAKGIEAKNIGNYQHMRTEVSVGISEKMKKKIEEIEFNLKKNEENEENVKNAIYSLVSAKFSKKGFSSEKEKLLEKMRRIQSALPKQREELEKEKENIHKELQKYKNAEIKVYNKIYPGVKITILDKKYMVNEERAFVSFKLIDDEIVCGKCH